jgi:hypothetical protein
LATASKPQGKDVGRYYLPKSIARKVRVEAAERGVPRSQVVAERLEQSYRNTPIRRSTED